MEAKNGTRPKKTDILKGFLDIANEIMAGAIRKISFSKGYETKDYALTEKWQEYSWVFRAQADNMQIAFQYLDTGLYEIDSLSIIAMPKKKKKKKKKKN